MTALCRSRSLALILTVLAASGLPAARPAARASTADDLVEILRTWSSTTRGDPAAVPRLASLAELRVRDRDRTRRPLARESRQIQDLVRGRPAVYVPILYLFSRAHELAVRSGKIRAATHLEFETSRLIAEFTEAPGSEHGRRLGSRFLTRLAGSLRNGPGLDGARRLLDEALDIDPENAVALHAAAAIEEKYGHYASAEDLLRRLLDLEKLPDAELRLALCTNRLGRTGEAERRLERLARGKSPDWVRAIAFQEWSRMRLEDGDLDSALALAREGYAKVPGDDSLAILVAFISGHRESRSTELVVQLTSGPTGTGPGARGLYNFWPPGMAVVDRELREETAAKMDALRQALGTPP